MEAINKGERLGFEAERRFLRETQRCRDAGQYPKWLGFFDKARPDEDAQGVDVWAYTDVGKIPLQIKHSDMEKDKFEKRENRRHIPCVVVHSNQKFDAIFKEAIELIAAERETILARKSLQNGET